MNKTIKKLTVAALLSTFLSVSCAPVFADTTILGGGTKGGVITDLGGAQINSNTSNYAQIGITGNGNTIQWNTLNVGSGKQLDFNFTQAGQVALNKVIGGQMSTFAGTLSTSGEAGRLIISNPVGMLFENNAVVNANSLILTTKDVNWDGNLFGRLELTDSLNGLNSKITVNNAKFTIADDLNIIAPNISIRNAQQSLLADNDVRLITTDGVNFVASSRNFETSIDNNNTAALGNIDIYNSKVLVKENSTGKVYVISKGDTNVERSSLAKAKVDSANSIIVKGGTAYYSNRIDDSELTAKTSIQASNLNSINNSTLRLTDNTTIADNIKIVVGSGREIHLVNSTLEGRYIYADKVNIESSTLNAIKKVRTSGSIISDSILTSVDEVNSGSAKLTSSTLTGKNIYADNAKIDASTLTATTKISVGKSTINNSELNSTLDINGGSANIINSSLIASTIGAGNSVIDSSILKSTANDITVTGATIKDATLNSESRVIAEKVNIKDSDITGKSTMTFDKFSTLDNVAIKLDNTMNFSTPGVTTVHLNDATLINGTKVSSPKICANRIKMNNSSLTAANDLSIIDGLLKNSSIAKSKYFVHDRHNVVTRDDSADNVVVENSTLISESDLNLKNGSFTGAVLNAANDVIINNATALEGETDYHATINAPNAATITNTRNFKVKAAAADISIVNSEIADNNLSATNTLSIKDSVFTSDVNVGNSNNLSIVDSTVKNLTVTDIEGINLENVNADSINIIDTSFLPVETPIVEDIVNEEPINMSTTEIISSVIQNDIKENKTRNTTPVTIASAVNTTLQKQFTPRGFAASTIADADEITIRINKVLSSAKIGENDTIITTQKFIAD